MPDWKALILSMSPISQFAEMYNQYVTRQERDPALQHDRYKTLAPYMPKSQAEAMDDVQAFASTGMSEEMALFRQEIPNHIELMLEAKREAGEKPFLSHYEIWLAHVFAQQSVQRQLPKKTLNLPTGFLYYQTGVVFHGVLDGFRREFLPQTVFSRKLISVSAEGFNDISEKTYERTERLRDDTCLGIVGLGSLLTLFSLYRNPRAIIPLANTLSKNLNGSQVQKVAGFFGKTMMGTGTLIYGENKLFRANQTTFEAYKTNLKPMPVVAESPREQYVMSVTFDMGDFAGAGL
ncbi:hypothetical protein [Archangium primigenium]|uniref:hypothetical protein n=1 Tax=[Archangium] primigenium TaxID=2792470 RepID=UPI001956BDE1|nr:hypothetical protein [Archangium primigenium]MBM7119496.1 hypothetical protein [Archangium primigenium]